MMILNLSKVLLHRMNSQLLRSSKTTATPIYRSFSTPSNGLNMVSDNKVNVSHSLGTNETLDVKPTADEKVAVSSCGDVHTGNDDDDDDDDMEQEEMFVEAHASFGHNKVEWGGPRRGGRLPEPTRFGDWERKGRCTDF